MINTLSFPTRLLRLLLMLFGMLFFLSGCDWQGGDTAMSPKKELLIYCGVTMIKPILEISHILEAQENVDIVITKGGSGNLMKSILYSKTGDLYLPGSENYFSLLEKEHPGAVVDTVFVGHNKAALMVQKGNPKKISNHLSNLTNPDLAVVIGNPDSGSIGKKTKLILERVGIYDQVLRNAVQLTTDSKDLVKMLRNGEADLVVNWYAVSTWQENRDILEAMEIESQYINTEVLRIGLLSYSKHQDIARSFMELAASRGGREIFRKHGLYFD